MEGWVKIHRKMLNWEWYKDTTTFCVFLHLLLKANHEDKRWKGVLIEKGQLITGRKVLAQELGLSEQIIRTALLKLKSTNEITIKSTTKYSLITINNWKSYQQETNKRTNEQPTTNQQLTTNKNDKNDKKEYPSAPRGEKPSKKKFTTLGADVLRAFELVDSKNKTYFNNPTQRAACDFLIEEYGMEKVLQAIKILPQINQKNLYIGQITTPYELKERWVKIKNALAQEKEIKKVKVI